MPTLITTIEDFSPVISYSGTGGNDWTSGTSNDSSIDKYSDSSFTVTQVANASVSFTFYGTGVQLYGAQRADHGSYQVTIDSHTYSPANGKVNGTEEVFQTQLFQTAALQNGLHKVTMVNLGTTKLDLDFITWQTPIGEDSESLLSYTIQDSDSSFKYTPASAWTTSPPNIGMFNGGSGHVTSTAGAFVEYSFKGAAVAIFGPVSPQGAPYSVRLDNGATTNYTTSKQFYQPQTMLFQAENLGSGAHTVRLTSEAWNNSALTFAIDYAQVYSTPSQQPAAGLAAGSIVAIIFGILLAFILAAAGYLFYRHRRGMVTDYGSIFPLRRSEYHPLGSSQGRVQSQPPDPYTTLQSPPVVQTPNSRWQTAIAASVNPQGISLPYIPDRKYRPEETPMPELTFSEGPSTSFRHSPLQNVLLLPARVSHTTEEGGGKLPFDQPMGSAPPEYARERPQ